MKNNMKKAWMIAKINFSHLTPAYIITAVFVIVGVWNLISCLTGLSDNTYVDMGNYLYMLAVFAPIFIASRNFIRIMHLNGNKHDYYYGALLVYVIIAAAVSALSIILFTVTEAVFGSRLEILNLMKVFSWWNHGVIAAFIQQFFFLLLVEVFVHTLTSIQNRWYGWLTDMLLIAIISIFIPIPMLRNLLAGFFNLIIFHANAMVQITCCLGLTIVLYGLSKPILQRKKM